MAKHFFLKLIPPRATFAFDMTVDEHTQMRQHVAYVHGLFEQGKVVIFGPVMDPADNFGMAVIEAESEEEARALMENDPTVKSGLNRYSLQPMLIGRARAT